MSPDARGATVLLVIWLLTWAIDRRLPQPAFVCAIGACWYGSWALLWLVCGLPLVGGVGGGFAAACGYHAWKRRPPRKRKPSKVLGRIRDRGRRLIVSPT